jgi:hyperosmotically inducible protein
LPEKVRYLERRWSAGPERQKDFAESFDTFSRKGLAINHFTTNLQRGVIAMEKRNIVIHCLVLLMLIATFAACASTSTHESTGEYVDDSVITTKVKSLLAEDDFLKSFQISVETYKGIVQLSGFVNAQNAVDKAGQIARSVKGVNSVKNNLIVK